MSQRKQKRPSQHSRPSKKRKKSSSSKFVWWTKILLNIFIWSAVTLSIVLLYFCYDLPDINRLSQTTRQPGISIVSKDGTMIATSGDIYGSQVDMDQLPPHVWQAILAVEDRRFFDHFGVDVFGLTRAAVANYQADKVVQGGSTITQQLA